MEASQKQTLLSLADKLKHLKPERIKALIGFDGFVDEIVYVVDKRTDIESYVRLGSMAEFAKRIEKSAGLSTNIEMVTVKQKLGGNGPIFANALIKLDYDIIYAGAIGIPDIHPVFQDMMSSSKMIALANPGRTDAIEFLDGKIISSKLETLKDINWNNLIEKIGVDRLIGFLDECNLVGFENWTMIHHMSEIWEHMLSEVLPRLKKRDVKPTIFFDLADPEKRKKIDILRALELIGRFSEYYYTVLGLNKKEASEISEVLGMSGCNQTLEALARFIFSKISVDMLVIHPVKEACVITKDGYCFAEGPYCKHPKITTGAGDNFNAGFVFGVLAGLDMEEMLMLGMAMSGYYVRYAESPDLGQVVAFLHDWIENRLDQ